MFHLTSTYTAWSGIPRQKEKTTFSRDQNKNAISIAPPSLPNWFRFPGLQSQHRVRKMSTGLPPNPRPYVKNSNTSMIPGSYLSHVFRERDKEWRLATPAWTDKLHRLFAGEGLSLRDTFWKRNASSDNNLGVFTRSSHVKICGCAVEGTEAYTAYVKMAKRRAAEHTVTKMWRTKQFLKWKFWEWRRHSDTNHNEWSCLRVFVWTVAWVEDSTPFGYGYETTQQATHQFANWN